MFGYQQYISIASSLRRIPFISKSLCIKVKDRQIRWLAFTSIILASACREPFDPDIKPKQTNYLVVEGFINVQGSTNIKLSRTGPLKDTALIKPEQGAAITIMGEDNSTIQLFENTGGNYQSDSLNLNKNQKYRLYIKTAEGKEYLSDYAAVKQTQPIDSVTWEDQNDGVHIYVNSHDAENKTIYYKWDYIETWEIDSRYNATLKYFPGNAADGSEGSVGARDEDELKQMKYCWQNISSTNIHLGSSASLAADVISQEPVTFIPHGSEQLSVRYSILVKQYALDKQAYEFYQLIKKNTESIGSIFDAQPSDISGNIHCTHDPAEKVIGYIGVSSEQTKRIFITNQQVGGAQWQYDPGCEERYVINNKDSLAVFLRGELYIPYSIKGLADGYFSVNQHCADCRTRGRSAKPDFW